MSGVHKTDDPSKVPAMPAVDRRAAGATTREPKLLDPLWDLSQSRYDNCPKVFLAFIR